MTERLDLIDSAEGVELEELTDAELLALTDEPEEEDEDEDLS
jgi:hypothetical protein